MGDEGAVRLPDSRGDEARIALGIQHRKGRETRYRKQVCTRTSKRCPDDGRRGRVVTGRPSAGNMPG